MNTRQIHPMAELATQAAALVPQPPADAINYLAWRELVWETARRLADLAGQSALPAAPELTTEPGPEAEGSADHLLGLAAMFQRHSDALARLLGPAEGTTPHRP